MRDRVPKMTHRGELKIGAIEVPCAVLDDGQRVLAAPVIARVFPGATDEGTSSPARRRAGLPALPVWPTSESMRPYLPHDLTPEQWERIQVKDLQGGKVFQAVDARILPALCEAWLRARDAGVLSPAQIDIAAQADLVMRGLAHVGIIALVDEATGYEKDRRRGELQQILAAYLAPELRPWVKEFPDEYYAGIFRLLGWSYSAGTSRRPGFVGHITNLVVYERMPPGVLAELKSRNPPRAAGQRSSRHHQHLSGDVGVDHLRRHLAAILALMRLADTWPQFVKFVQRAYPKEGDQLGMFDLATWRDDS